MSNIDWSIAMGEVIHVHVYDPSNSLFGKKSDRAEIHTYTCGKTSVCDAYKQGRCIMVGNPFGARCFGRMTRRGGPTKRARSFHDFIASGMRHEKYRALSTQPNKVFRVGDGYMMPYPHINLDGNSPFESKSGFMRGGMPYIESPTAEDLSVIYRQRPQSIMGGEIKDYQSKHVPQIVKHMHDEYPNLYRMLILKHPEASKHVEDFDFTGKKAVLKTLLPGPIVISKKTWQWDGKYLTGAGSNMLLAPADAIEVRVKPSDDAVVVVSNAEMVGVETKIDD